VPRPASAGSTYTMEERPRIPRGRIEAREAGGRVLRGGGEHGLAAALEPGLARPDEPGRRVAHPHLQGAREQAADAPTLVAMGQGHAARREVDAVETHQVPLRWIQRDRVLEQRHREVAGRGRVHGRAAGAEQLVPQHARPAAARARRARARPVPGGARGHRRRGAGHDQLAVEDEERARRGRPRRRRLRVEAVLGQPERMPHGACRTMPARAGSNARAGQPRRPRATLGAMTPPGAAQDGMPTTRGTNFFLADPNLDFVVSTVVDPPTLERARPHLVALGEIAGGELDALAAEADRHPPTLRTHDARGARVDEIVKHPAYERMERLAFERFGLAALSHREGVLGWPGRAPHVVKYALSYLFAQAEFGLLCPVSVTDSTARVLRWFADDALQAAYLPRLTATELETLWQGAQWMTERTGGSDVGATATRARQDADGTWRLWGAKWFCSVANAGVALALARPEGAPAGTRGLGLFLVPRALADGTRNAWTLDRLKDKLGSRSMATGEVTLSGAVGYPVGPLDRGFAQMMEMVNVSRVSNAMRAAAIMRRSVLESTVHARGRAAFGRPLAELPQLRRDLLEMLLDAEGGASVVLNAAALLDRADGGAPEARRLVRIVTPLAKSWLTARARAVAGEAMNVRGGNGYIEEWVNARLLRDAHLGAIWEGSTNVVALDVQRALLRDGCLAPLAAFVGARLATVAEPVAKPWVERVEAVLADLARQVAGWAALDPPTRELEARPAADTLYHALAAGLLLAEGHVLVERRGDFRKHLAAAMYVHRWLTPRAATGSTFSWGALRWLDALVDWTPVPADALAALEPGR
jgi:acyl-CoA dehydrogenase